MAILLAAGSLGKHPALPNARVLIHQPAMEGMQGQASDTQIVVDEIDRIRTWLEDTISKYSGKPVGQVRHDIERDKILTVHKPPSTVWSTRYSSFIRLCDSSVIDGAVASPRL